MLMRSCILSPRWLHLKSRNGITHLPSIVVAAVVVIQRQMQKNVRIKIKTRQRQILILSICCVSVCVRQSMCEHSVQCICLLQSFALWIEMSFYLHMGRIVAYETHSQIFATLLRFWLHCKKTLKKAKCLPQIRRFLFLLRYLSPEEIIFVFQLLHCFVHWKLLFSRPHHP